jgi:hypothetical protein
MWTRSVGLLRLVKQVEGEYFEHTTPTPQNYQNIILPRVMWRYTWVVSQLIQSSKIGSRRHNGNSRAQKCRRHGVTTFGCTKGPVRGRKTSDCLAFGVSLRVAHLPYILNGKDRHLVLSLWNDASSSAWVSWFRKLVVVTEEFEKT